MNGNSEERQKERQEQNMNVPISQDLDTPMLTLQPANVTLESYAKSASASSSLSAPNSRSLGPIPTLQPTNSNSNLALTRPILTIRSANLNSNPGPTTNSRNPPGINPPLNMPAPEATASPNAGNSENGSTPKTSAPAAIKMSTGELEVSLLNVLFDTAARNRKQALLTAKTARERELVRDEELSVARTSMYQLRTEEGKEHWRFLANMLRLEIDASRVEEKWGLQDGA